MDATLKQLIRELVQMDYQVAALQSAAKDAEARAAAAEAERDDARATVEKLNAQLAEREAAAAPAPLKKAA